MQDTSARGRASLRLADFRRFCERVLLTLLHSLPLLVNGRRRLAGTLEKPTTEVFEGDMVRRRRVSFAGVWCGVGGRHGSVELWVGGKRMRLYQSVVELSEVFMDILFALLFLFVDNNVHLFIFCNS